MPRTYLHPMSLPGASPKSDTEQLGGLVEQAVRLGMNKQAFEDALCQRTGFERSVRGWFGGADIPNGMMRRILLNAAREIVDQRDTSRPDTR
jgi:hypothetical protein